MKKIATLTFHNAINVGAVLQAYALQKTIEELGAESELIDYRNRYIENKYSILYTPSNNPISIIKTVLMIPVRIARANRFRKFIQENINTSRRIRSDSDFVQMNDEYDAFFVGSDQVWNPYHTGDVDGRFFLDFVKDAAKKKSYAASFGLTELPEKYNLKYKSLLDDFDEISVREQSASVIIKDMAKKDASVVLDPVFLLDTSRWVGLLKRPQKISRKYLLIFCVNGLTKDMIQYSVDMAEKKSLDVVYLSSRPQRIRGVKVVTNFAPREFLGYIESADYIVTDSFHAMSFSIIFQKDFSLKVASQHGNKNNRSLELMDRLGIKNRILSEENGNIEWNDVYSKIAIEKEQSINFLKENIF